jgi:hypothetical protein
VNLAATTDLRGEDVWPWMRRVISKRGDEQARKLVRLLQEWHRSGANRLDSDGDNVYEHSGAVALMDSWWPKFVTAEFEPALGTNLFEMVRDNVLGFGDAGWDWSSQVQKDLRGVLVSPEKDRYSRIYCGGPRKQPKTRKAERKARKSCRQVLLSTLADAYKEVSAAQGSSNPADWKVYALCDDPDTCDEIVPNTAGAVETPPFPWQNRGTCHQNDEIKGHR